MRLPPITLQGAKVLFPDGFRNGSISLAEGQVVGECYPCKVNLQGYWILPGVVDLHGDGFERHLAPRRGAIRDATQGMRMAAAELAVNGITTAVLAQFFSWEGGLRSPEAAIRMANAMREAAPRVATDLRLQLRFETHMLDHYAEFEALVARTGCRYVVFNDHLPHDALSKGKRPPRLTGTALKSGRNPEKHLELMQAMHARRHEVPEAVARLARRLVNSGVRLGSHDDPTAEIRQTWRKCGIRISEFPETREAARGAHDAGDRIILGSPNVLRGGSHKGNVSAPDLIEEGLCDALASDYHYPAPRLAALSLAQKVGLEKAWPLVSAGPARILDLTDRGVLAPGLRADLVIVDPDTGDVMATIAAGQVSHLAGEVACRFLSSAGTA